MIDLQNIVPIELSGLESPPPLAPAETAFLRLMGAYLKYAIPTDTAGVQLGLAQIQLRLNVTENVFPNPGVVATLLPTSTLRENALGLDPSFSQQVLGDGGYRPLERYQLVFLLNVAAYAALVIMPHDLYAGAVLSSQIQTRLYDAIPGMTLPRPDRGPITDRMNALGELYQSSYVFGVTPELIDAIWRLIN